MSHHYPKGYEPQTYGERKLADSMTTKQIEDEIMEKERLYKKDPEEYDRIYRGSSGK